MSDEAENKDSPETDLQRVVHTFRAIKIPHEMDAPSNDHKTLWVEVDDGGETINVDFCFDAQGKFLRIGITR